MTLLTLATATTTGATSQAAPDDDAPRPRISASNGKVDFGQRIVLRGAIPAPALAGGASASGVAASSSADAAINSTAPARARIEFRPAGKSGWRQARDARLDGRGRYRVRVRVQRSGAFRVLGEGAAVSRAQPVRVRPKLGVGPTKRHVRIGQRVKLSGSVRPGGAPRGVRVRVGGQTLRTRTNRSGRFTVRWRAVKAGRFSIRVAAGSNPAAAGSHARGGRVTVYRAAVASWYGPGLYGNGLACGGTLTPSTLGVAHRTLPCGTKLTLRHGSRSVRVRVIDRGPFVAGREFDLTSATRQRLGFGSTGAVLSSR